MKDRVERLSPRQRKALLGRLAPAGSPSRAKALFGFVALRPGTQLEEVREYVESRLPASMVPRLVALEKLPRLPNGKVDRGALSFEKGSQTRSEAAATRPERDLVEIWSAVLGLELVGAHDNFFEIGGDSLSSIQVISRARAAGLPLRPGDLFEHPTVFELAEVIAGRTAPQADARLPLEPFALTPIQHWFFSLEMPKPAHWNLGWWLSLPDPVDMGTLRGALATLEAHHDSLRLRFSRSGSEWVQSYAEPGPEAPLLELEELAEPELSRLQAGFDLESGRLWRAVRVRDRLLFLCHHLVVDQLSWPILVEDLARAYAQLTLPERTASYASWAAALEQRDPGDELDYWRAQVSPEPVVTASEGEVESLVLRVDHPGEALQAYGTTTEEMLLTALAMTLCLELKRDHLVVGLESHGRSGLDLARSVGWFTSFFPLRLEPGVDPAAALCSVKEARRAVPGGGLGYGVLRYLRKRPELTRCAEPSVLFNYLGPASPPSAGPFSFLEPELRFSRDPSNTRRILLEVNAALIGDSVELVWSSCAGCYRLERIAPRFRDTLATLVTHCTAPDSGGYTPSDFPEADLDQDSLDRLLGLL